MCADWLHAGMRYTNLVTKFSRSEANLGKYQAHTSLVFLQDQFELVFSTANTTWLAMIRDDCCHNISWLPCRLVLNIVGIGRLRGRSMGVPFHRIHIQPPGTDMDCTVDHIFAIFDFGRSWEVKGQH